MSLQIALTNKNVLTGLYLPVVFMTIHISYGWGYLVGLCKLITGSKMKVEINR